MLRHAPAHVGSPATPSLESPLSQSSHQEPRASAHPRRWTRPAAILAVWTAYGALQIALFEAAQSGESLLRWTVPVLLAVAACWAVLTPLVFWLARTLTSARASLWVRLPVHALWAVAIAALVTYVRWFTGRTVDAGTDTPYVALLVHRLDYNIVTYVLLVSVGRAVYLRDRYLARARRTLLLEAQLAQTRLEFLQRQLHPHFLFNALNAVAELVREAPDVARRTIGHLQQLLQGVLDRAGATEITLAEELSTLQPFIEVQQTRFGDALHVEHRIDARALDALVPTLVLQPLVENAIRHGLAGRRTGGRIEVVAEIVRDRLRLCVIDDGVGPPREPGRRRGGLGLRNTRQRLLALYGADCHFELSGNSGAGAVAALEIPLRHESVRPAPVAALSLPAAANDPRAADVEPEPVPLLARDHEDARGDAKSRAVDVVTLGVTEGGAATSPDHGLADGARQRSRAVFPGMSARGWAAVTGLWIACGIYWMFQAIAVQLVMGVEVVWLAGIIDLYSAAVWATLTPCVLWLAHVLPVRGRRRLWRLAAHAVIAATFSVVHLTTVFWLGDVDRPLLFVGHVFPFMINVFIYSAFVAWSHARDFARWDRSRALAAAQLETQIARARWQAVSLELRPQFLLGALSGVAALIAGAPLRAERAVERLADVLRAMLELSGQPVRSVREEIHMLELCFDLYGTLTGVKAELVNLVPRDWMDEAVSGDVFRTIMNDLPLGEHARPVRLRVGGRLRNGRRELLVRADAPLFANGDADVDAWFPDNLTAVVRLRSEGAAAGAPTLTPELAHAPGGA